MECKTYLAADRQGCGLLTNKDCYYSETRRSVVCFHQHSRPREFTPSLPFAQLWSRNYCILLVGIARVLSAEQN